MGSKKWSYAVFTLDKWCEQKSGEEKYDQAIIKGVEKNDHN